MATKSLIKHVRIRDRKLAKGLANALENAENKSSKDVLLLKKLEAIKSEDVKDFFQVK